MLDEAIAGDDLRLALTARAATAEIRRVDPILFERFENALMPARR